MNKDCKDSTDDRHSTLCGGSCTFHCRIFCWGEKDFTYASDHFYVSGGNSSDKNLAVMEKQQIDDFTKLDVDFSNH